MARRRAWARRGHGCAHGEDTGAVTGTKGCRSGHGNETGTGTVHMAEARR